MVPTPPSRYLSGCPNPDDKQFIGITNHTGQFVGNHPIIAQTFAICGYCLFYELVPFAHIETILDAPAGFLRGVWEAGAGVDLDFDDDAIQADDGERE